jgi:hypothetical protein
VALRSDRARLRLACRDRAWALTMLASVAVATLAIVSTETPWTEYMYGLTVCVLALAGFCLSALVRRIGATRLLAPFAAGLTIVLIAALPSHYRPGPRPIYDGVRHLGVIRDQLDQPGSVLVASQDTNYICNYLARSYDRVCGFDEWPTLQAELGPRTSLRLVLKRAGATAIYADASMLADPTLAGLLARPGAYGWRQVAAGSGIDGPWRVLVRAKPSKA